LRKILANTLSLNWLTQIKNTLIRKQSILLVLLVLLKANFVFAQDPGGPSGGSTDAPIDGGLSILIAAGIGYGAKKLNKRMHKP